MFLLTYIHTTDTTELPKIEPLRKSEDAIEGYQLSFHCLQSAHLLTSLSVCGYGYLSMERKLRNSDGLSYLVNVLQYSILVYLIAYRDFFTIEL